MSEDIGDEDYTYTARTVSTLKPLLKLHADGTLEVMRPSEVEFDALRERVEKLTQRVEALELHVKRPWAAGVVSVVDWEDNL